MPSFMRSKRTAGERLAILMVCGAIAFGVSFWIGAVYVVGHFVVKHW